MPMRWKNARSAGSRGGRVIPREIPLEHHVALLVLDDLVLDLGVHGRGRGVSTHRLRFHDG